MSFDPQISEVLRYANNFFASGYTIVALVAGIAIGAFAIRVLLSLFQRRA
ncbi:hypothetical protein [Caldinitratiruptor microaerophilus]|uniref:Uncharacterized protein n=1 Tax=Caldinitratiruptor microaerophilus TaxID=671077 RepID=A0AA35CJ85_9FIRM|nr:hypothetical protein [Caldinitratiruptor microaerophilus]BDG60270.1 hypothetical protein caldi_13600 [Caldinitratiruptor microaerophilus]